MANTRPSTCGNLRLALRGSSAYTGMICKQQLRAKMITGRPLIISKKFQLNCGSEEILTPLVQPV